MGEFSPGWYPDPNNSLRKRYWNGSEWTPQTTEASAGADAWANRLNGTEDFREIGVSSQETIATSGLAESPRFWKGLAIVLAVVIGFSSCAVKDSWRMGVDGNGYTVYCEDGTISKSGGIQGACSHHGGVR